MDAGKFLVGPFDGLFTMDDAKWELAVNWGIAAALWLVAGALVARLLVSIGTAGRSRRRHRRGFGWGEGDGWRSRRGLPKQRLVN